MAEYLLNLYKKLNRLSLKGSLYLYDEEILWSYNAPEYSSSIKDNLWDAYTGDLEEIKSVHNNVSPSYVDGNTITFTIR